MPGLTAQQKAAVIQFVSFTQADKKAAEKVLKSHNWNLQQAVDGFFSAGNATQNTGTSDRHSSALNKMFDKYRDTPTDSPDTISINGTMTYLSDLSLSPDHISVLVLSELLSSPTLGEITRQGFTTGWSQHGTTTIPTQRQLLSTLTGQLNTPQSRAQGGLFRRVYKHTFKLACPAGSKSVPLEMACEYWKLLLGPQGIAWDDACTAKSGGGKMPWLQWYLDFLNDRWKKAVNRDLWEQTVVFEEMTREDPELGWWSEDGAWPGVIDEFVAWVRAEKGVGRSGSGEAMEVE